MIKFRSGPLGVAVGLMLAALLADPSWSQEMRFFRIGTGGIGGTYYPIGGMVAGAISNPPGSRPCDKGGSCGVPGLVAIAQTSEGSVQNIEAVAAGIYEAGFVQSDVAFWAYNGTGIYARKKPYKSIRAIASLYPESVHLVVRRDRKIETLADLKARIVSLGEPGSGTLVDARLILSVANLRERYDLEPRYLGTEASAARLLAGEIDAFFAVAGYPALDVLEVVRTGTARILPIAGEAADLLMLGHSFFSNGAIPAGVYGNSADIPTISVNALLIVRAKADEQLIHAITRSLWNDKSRKLFDEGHEKGRLIRLSSALDGIGIPLHPGAERYYREAGLLK